MQQHTPLSYFTARRHLHETGFIRLGSVGDCYGEQIMEHYVRPSTMEIAHLSEWDGRAHLTVARGDYLEILAVTIAVQAGRGVSKDRAVSAAREQLTALGVEADWVAELGGVVEVARSVAAHT